MGDGFLAEVVRDWEAAAEPAREAGIRVVNLRFGIVQSAAGGALRAQLPLFRLGLGGRVGNGRQYVSWVAIDDVVGAIEFALGNERLSGPANVSAPQPVTNAEYARTLGRVLHRPAVLPAPAPAVRLVLGEFSGELLGGQRVRPDRLLESGFEFQYPELEGALRHVLGRPARAKRSAPARPPAGPRRTRPSPGGAPRRRRRAGWRTDARSPSRAPRAADSTNRPRSRVTRNSRPSSACAATEPRHTSTRGFTSASSDSSHGRQALISSALGFWWMRRLPRAAT